jgi:hypothetical protein
MQHNIKPVAAVANTVGRRCAASGSMANVVEMAAAERVG